MSALDPLAEMRELAERILAHPRTIVVHSDDESEGYNLLHSATRLAELVRERDALAMADVALALWFTPDAIREHFADDDGEIAEAIAAATDEQLRAIGEDALQADVIYREFHDELMRSAAEVLFGDEQPEPPEREPDLPMPGDRP